MNGMESNRIQADAFREVSWILTTDSRLEFRTIKLPHWLESWSESNYYHLGELWWETSKKTNSSRHQAISPLNDVKLSTSLTVLYPNNGQPHQPHTVLLRIVFYWNHFERTTVRQTKTILPTNSTYFFMALS